MSFDKTAIEEANKHLLALSQRVVELEALAKNQAERLENIDVENQAKIDLIIRQKDAEIQKQNAWLQSTQAEIRRLSIDIINKDVTISQLKAKASILDRALRYKGDIEGLLNCFKEVETFQAEASGGTPAILTRPNIVKTSSLTSNTIESKNSDNSSESSLSEEDFSENEQQGNVIWTPKAKIQPDNQGIQNLNLNGRKSYAPPVRVPGGAVKNAGDADMDTEPEQLSSNSEKSSTSQIVEKSQTEFMPSYETQL